jgi:hypothetical protein
MKCHWIIQDEEPLASLPLIGYAVTKPDEVSQYCSALT